MNKHIEKQILELCKNLYRIGFNDGSHEVKYHPEPSEFYADKLKVLFYTATEEIIGEQDWTSKNASKRSELVDAARNGLRMEQKERRDALLK